MGNAISSLIFTFRSGKKAKNGDIGRAPIAVGQAKNAFTEISKFDNIAGNATKAATSIFTSSKLNDCKALKYTGKAVNFVSKNINPLICVSSGIKIAKSDDKVKTGLVEIGALSGMFMGEGLMKKYQDNIFTSKNVEKIVQKAMDKGIFKTLGKKILSSNAPKDIALITKGLAFVGASISSYALGEKAGTHLANEIKPNLKKINQTV